MFITGPIARIHSYISRYETRPPRCFGSMISSVHSIAAVESPLPPSCTDCSRTCPELNRSPHEMMLRLIYRRQVVFIIVPSVIPVYLDVGFYQLGNDCHRGFDIQHTGVDAPFEERVTCVVHELR